MNNITLKAEPRKILGRKVGSLRKVGVLPANIYGKNVKSQAVQVSLGEFEKVFKAAGETGLVELDLGKDKRPVLTHNVQKDPVTDFPIHVDFLQVDLKQKVTASVPVELTGESPAEKQALGTVVQYINEIEVEALPVDLPEKFVVDISTLTEVDQAVYVKELDYDKKKVEVKVDLEQIVAKVEPPQKEEVVAPPAEVVEEGAEVVPETPEAPEGEKKEEAAEEEKPQESNS